MHFDSIPFQQLEYKLKYIKLRKPNKEIIFKETLKKAKFGHLKY